MNTKIREHLTAYSQANGWGTSDDELFELIRESPRVYREITSSHRWYDDTFYVVDVNGMLIGYNGFHITGDNSPEDMGLDYDIDTVCEVEAKQKLITYYEAI